MILCLIVLSCGNEEKEPDEEFEEEIEEEVDLMSLLDSISKDKYYTTDLFSEINLEINGVWKFFAASGGISGGGYTLDFDYLVIKPNSIFGIVKDDVLIQSGNIEIISEPNEEVMIQFFSEIVSNPVNINLTGDTKTVIIESNEMHLVSGCCDRFSESFTKEN